MMLQLAMALLTLGALGIGADQTTSIFLPIIDQQTLMASVVGTVGSLLSKDWFEAKQVLEWKHQDDGCQLHQRN